MKKVFLILIVLAGISGFTYLRIEENKLSAQEVSCACTVLSKLTDEAVRNGDKDEVALYFNTFQAIKNKYPFSQSCTQYFDDIKTTQGNAVGEFRIGMSRPPLIYKGPSGGFTHKEVSLMNKMKDLNVEETDLDQLMLYKGFIEGKVDITRLKATEIDGLNKMQQSLEKMDLKKLDQKKISEFENKEVKVEEFQKMIKNE